MDESKLIEFSLKFDLRPTLRGVGIRRFHLSNVLLLTRMFDFSIFGTTSRNINTPRVFVFERARKLGLDMFETCVRSAKVCVAKNL